MNQTGLSEGRIEQVLRSSYTPAIPRDEFIRLLKNKLEREIRDESKLDMVNNFEQMMYYLIGMFGALILLFFGIRFIRIFLSKCKVIRDFEWENEPEIEIANS